MDDYTLSMADAINEHQGNADADHSVNVSMADAINEYQDRFSADTEGVTEHQATIPADTNHSPGAKIVFACRWCKQKHISHFSHLWEMWKSEWTNLVPFCSTVPGVEQVERWNKWNTKRAPRFGSALCAVIEQCGFYLT